MELIELLTDQLGIRQAQAQAGAGLLFKFAKEKLDTREFSQISEHVPGAAQLVDLAPESGVLGVALGNLACLVVGFANLGLNSDMVGKFVRIITSFAQEKGRDAVKGLIFKVLT